MTDPGAAAPGGADAGAPQASGASGASSAGGGFGGAASAPLSGGLEPARRGLAGQAAEGLGSLQALFDPASVVPGGAALLACLLPLIYQGRVSLGTWGAAHVLGAAVMASVMGLVCSTAGRRARTQVSRALGARGALHHGLWKALVGHRLATRLRPSGPGDREAGGVETPLAAYESAEPLLRRLWVEVERDPALAPTARRVARRHAQALAHDGLAVAFLVWAAVFWLVPSRLDAWPVGWNGSLVVGGLFVALAVGSWAEAHRLEKDEVQDLVAAVAARAGVVDRG